jgi:hypothetical protein
MTITVCYWDSETNSQQERDATPEEIAEIEARAVPQPPTPADFDAALTLHLDATAQARRYDNRITCMVRAGFPGPFQAEGLAFAAWADSCNAFAYQLLADVLSGAAPMPASVQSFIDMLPPMEWPA